MRFNDNSYAQTYIIIFRRVREQTFVSSVILYIYIYKPPLPLYTRRESKPTRHEHYTIPIHIYVLIKYRIVMALCVFCPCKYLKVVPVSDPQQQLLRRPSPSRAA